MFPSAATDLEVETTVLFPDSMLFDAWVLQEGSMLPEVDAVAKACVLDAPLPLKTSLCAAN